MGLCLYALGSGIGFRDFRLWALGFRKGLKAGRGSWASGVGFREFGLGLAFWAWYLTALACKAEA